MAEFLPEKKARRKSGNEAFQGTVDRQALRLREFWAWSLSNATRGILAEYLVAVALGVADGVRSEWDAYDLTSVTGTTVEVKSAAYLQTWHQERLSDIGFSISESRAWDPATNKMSCESRRQADVYVFCLLHHKDKSTVNPMDLKQWGFHVVASKTIDERCGTLKRLSLKRLLDLSPVKVEFGGIRDAIEAMANTV